DLHRLAPRRAGPGAGRARAPSRGVRHLTELALRIRIVGNHALVEVFLADGRADAVRAIQPFPEVGRAAAGRAERAERVGWRHLDHATAGGAFPAHRKTIIHLRAVSDRTTQAGAFPNNLYVSTPEPRRDDGLGRRR